MKSKINPLISQCPHRGLGSHAHILETCARGRTGRNIFPITSNSSQKRGRSVFGVFFEDSLAVLVFGGLKKNKCFSDSCLPSVQVRSESAAANVIMLPRAFVTL